MSKILEKWNSLPLILIFQVASQKPSHQSERLGPPLLARLLSSCTSCRIPATIYNNYFTYTFQVVCIRTRSCHLKVFIFVVKLRDTSLKVYEKILPFIIFYVFTLILSEGITITSSEEALKLCNSFFQKIWTKSNVTCILLVQLRFI